MKNIHLFTLLLSMMVTNVMGQEKQPFTLNDVIPGGSNFYSMQPQRMSGLKWWGETCINADTESVATVNLKSGKQETLFTLEEVNAAIQDAYKDIKPLKSLKLVHMPYANKSIAIFNHNKHIIFYNFEDKKISECYAVNEKASNFDFCSATGNIAYSVNDNLHIAGKGINDIQIHPENKECITFDGKTILHNIVYGQSVHRQEFGIYKGTFWSPAGNYLAFYKMDQSMVADYPQVNTTTRISTLEPDKYPMAGMTSHKVYVGIYNIESGKTVYLKTADPTNRYFTNVSWAPDEKSIYLIEVNRDQNHAQLIRYNATTGEKEAVLYEETHDKYVEPQHVLEFLPWDETKFIYQTQRNGFNHLYLFDTKLSQDGKEQNGLGTSRYKEYVKVRQITDGNWMVNNILGFNTSNKEVIVSSTEVSPLQSNIFSISIKTGKRTMVGEENATHYASLSANGKYIIDNYTSFDIPRNAAIVPTNGKKGTILLSATNPMEENFNMPEVTIGTLKAADGKTELYYRLIKPVNFDPNKKYPAIIYVYGGPHAQLIRNTTNYDARGWDLYMAQKGYVMLTVDSRGSDKRGREFENCTFRHLGIEEMKDQVEGAKMLQSLPYVDASKIGVHGWSYGGFMTTNLMLTYPEIFKVGVAGGPVIDWKYYEVMYGERYMDTPQSNPEGYKGSDLKQKAGNLKGRLLIIHGGMDPTCVPQHTYTFLRACIDAGTHPDLFIYPEDGHNMVGPDRVHLHEHITRYFEDFLK